MTRKTTPALTLAALLLTGFAALTPAHAGADGRRNTTLALGAAAVYELLQHKTTNALVLGAGAAYAEKQYENARKSERDARDDRRYYRPFPGDRNNGGPYDNGDRSRNSSGPYDNGGGDYDHHTRPFPSNGHDDTQPFPSDGNRDRRNDRDDSRRNCNDNQGNRNDSHDQHDNRGWDGHSQPPGQPRERYQPWPGGR